MKKNLTVAVIFLMLCQSFFSCATNNIEKTETVEKKVKETQENSSPVIGLKTRGLKCEIEDMVLENCSPESDESASGKKCVRFSNNSKARIDIELPEGKYELLFSQKAFSTAGSHIQVTLNEDMYDTYPSEPPLGAWELTIRKPIVFFNEKPRTVSLSISKKESPGQDFFVDYFQIVRIAR